MSRLSKFLLVLVAVVFVLACNFVTQPLKDVQDIAGTAQAVGTQIPIQTLQALPTLFASAVPAETLEALPSALPTFEAIATQFGNALNPQGAPVQEWKGIPIMPQATAGQEFAENNTYSFKANVTAKEVQDFYAQQLTNLGWKQPFNFPGQGDSGILVFQKDSSILTITIKSSDGAAVVRLTLVA